MTAENGQKNGQGNLQASLAGDRRGDWRGTVVGVIISLVCLAVIFSLIDLRQLGEALRLADYRWVAACAVISLAWLTVRALAWRALLKNKPAYSHVFFSINQGYLLNNLLPFRLGEVGRAFLLGQKSGMGFLQVFPSIIVERLVDLMLAVGLFLVTLLFVVGADWALPAALLTGAVMVAGLVMLFLVARNRSRTEALAGVIGQRVPLVGRLAGRLLPSVLDGLSILTDTRQFLVSLGWLLLDWVIAVFQYHFMMLAFFPQAQPLWSAFTLASAALGLAVPSSPSGIGVFEFAAMTALAQFVDDPARTFAFALTTHILQITLTGILGGYALARDGESLAGLYRKIRSLKGRDAVQ